MSQEQLRIFFFLGVFAFLSLLEFFLPRRELEESKKKRWFSNLSLIFIGNICVKLFLPITVIEFSLWVQSHDLGFLNFLAVPQFFTFVLGLLFLDLAIYVQHVIFHKVNFLWKIHRVHHVDKDIDVTTGLRFHPLEIILSLFIKISVVFLLGISPFTIFVFEIILNTTSMFNHSNLSLPLYLDKILRFFVVTPDMHRVHHSVYLKETDSNFGFNLPWWDYLFNTYVSQPKDGHRKMKIGMKHFRSKKYISLLVLLLLPFFSLKKKDL